MTRLVATDASLGGIKYSVSDSPAYPEGRSLDRMNPVAVVSGDEEVLTR